MCSVLEESTSLEGDRIWLYKLSIAQPQATFFTAQPFPKAWLRAPSLRTEEQVRPPLLWEMLNSVKSGAWETYSRWRKGAKAQSRQHLVSRSYFGFGCQDTPWGTFFSLVLHWPPTFSIGQIFPDGFLTSEMEVSNGNPCGPLT